MRAREAHLPAATVLSPAPLHTFFSRQPEGTLPKHRPSCGSSQSKGPLSAPPAALHKAPPLTQRVLQAPGTSRSSYPSNSSLHGASPPTTPNVIPCLRVPFLWPSTSPYPPSPAPRPHLLLSVCLLQGSANRPLPSEPSLTPPWAWGSHPLPLHGTCQAVCPVMDPHRVVPVS